MPSAPSGNKKRRGRKREARAASRTVGELMRHDFITISADGDLVEAVDLMRLARLRHLLVERGGVLVGLLSYRDLQDTALGWRKDGGPHEPEALRGRRVESAMTASPYLATVDLSLAEAARRLRHLHIGCLPVVESSAEGPRLVGLVTEIDLLGAAFEPGGGRRRA